jgi:manganese transport protein
VSPDAATIRDAAEVLAGKSRKGRLARLLPFFGPAFIASVAYIDPGNFATNIQGGAEFGYTLLWVVVASNLSAMLVQALSAKLGIATGKNLAELCREHYPRPVVLSMWILMELVAMATDLAEFLGAAIGFNLLFGIPLWVAGLLTAVATVLILGLERYGFRPLEAVITVLVGVVSACYVIETILDRPQWTQVLPHAVIPGFAGTESVLLATGILGATVMPHVVFLHSALTQNRIVVRNRDQLRRLFHFELIDVAVAMTVAGLVNGAMLIMAAATFYTKGLTSIASIEEAHRTLAPLLGSSASVVFAVSLLASGLSSSTVGTMSGQVIMQVTLAPSLFVIIVGWDPTRTLVMSQVVLSFGLPFALVPLVQFTRRGEVMGVLVNRRHTTAAAVVVTAAIIVLNAYLLYQTLLGG